MTSRVLHAAGQSIEGTWEAPVGVPCGLWEHPVGESTDTEVHEVFVVLTGRARIEIEGQGPLEIGPGDVVELEAGARTRWIVREHLRKFWLVLD
jgi:uncharacterized cupin superfamily protein